MESSQLYKLEGVFLQITQVSIQNIPSLTFISALDINNSIYKCSTHEMNECRCRTFIALWSNVMPYTN